MLWHVHGSWTTAFVRGPHTYLVPVTPDRGPDGRGRARTFPWPASVVELSPQELAQADVDLVVLQRPHEEALAARWLGRRPGRDLPAVYLEHNAPQGRINDLRHPVADRPDLTLVHVTAFNDLFWDAGSTRRRVIEHGIVDPGHRYTGEVRQLAAVVNEPVRRARVTGTDLLPAFAAAATLDVFGMGVDALPDDHVSGRRFVDLPQERMHDELSRRRVYVHPPRWTSLGLSLIEAMHLGMPVVALATTEAPVAVPDDAGVLSTRVEDLIDAARRFVAEPEAAAACGKRGRAAALRRYGLQRFLGDWDRLLREVTA